MKQTHPDLLVIEPSKDDNNKSGFIKTNQIRKLNSFFAHSAGREGWRVAIINSLDLVNRNGQNAMLKILEEPPQHSILLVLNHQQASILPTVKSRCMYAAMSRLNTPDTQKILNQIWPAGDENHIALLSKLCDGSPGQAINLEQAEALSLFEASCHLLFDEATRAQDLWDIAHKWGPEGNKGRTVRMAALYLFEKLISRASLSATGNQNYESEFDTIPFVKNTIEVLASRHNAHTLANFHQAFCLEIRQAERLFLDFTPILANFLCKLHSQTLPE
jgi:DNA polymerase-3 subunit delta'